MPSIRIDSKEKVVATGWPGVRDALPVRVSSVSASDAGVSANAITATPAVWWTRTALRFARDATIGMLLLMSVPLVVVGVSRGSRWTNAPDLRARIADAERWRPLMAPKNPAIAPLQAGRALHALQLPHKTTDFPEHVVAGRGEQPWKQHPLSAEMFATLRSPGYDGPVASRVIEAAGRGFSRAELAYLRAVAVAPLWYEFDKLTSAPRVDLIGGQFVLPFKDNAFALSMPYRRFAETKALAYAGVSRAAYLVATGQPRQAEAALRSIVSFGFVLIDNGTSTLDALVGRLIADIGRDGLHQLYTLTGNADGLAQSTPYARMPKSAATSRTRIDMARWQGQLLDDVRDPHMPRTLRYESLMQLSFTTCGSVREMLWGPSANVRGAFDRAGTMLARFPSERAYIDVIQDVTNRTPPGMVSERMTSRLIMGAATVAGTVLHNPRVVSCTRVALALDR